MKPAPARRLSRRTIVTAAVVLLGAALVVMCAVAWRANRRFRAACLASRSGEPLADVEARLRDAGGVYVGKVQKWHEWFRPKGWSLEGATCAVVDDEPPNPVAPDPSIPLPPGARVVSAEYSENLPLL